MENLTDVSFYFLGKFPFLCLYPFRLFGLEQVVLVILLGRRNKQEIVVFTYAQNMLIGPKICLIMPWVESMLDDRGHLFMLLRPPF